MIWCATHPPRLHPSTRNVDMTKAKRINKCMCYTVTGGQRENNKIARCHNDFKRRSWNATRCAQTSCIDRKDRCGNTINTWAFHQKKAGGWRCRGDAVPCVWKEKMSHNSLPFSLCFCSKQTLLLLLLLLPAVAVTYNFASLNKKRQRQKKKRLLRKLACQLKITLRWRTKKNSGSRFTRVIFVIQVFQHTDAHHIHLRVPQRKAQY